MKISIPEKIKSEIDVIEAVYLETANTNAGEQSPAFVGSIISDKHIRAVPFIELSNTIFENCTHIQYRIVYKNGITEIIKFSTKQNSLYKTGANSGANLCIRHKMSDIYPDTDDGRKQCLNDIDEKIIESSKYSDSAIGNKNLIYYSVYFNNGYTDLLELSINSILKNSKINFDILIITDESTKEIIERSSFVKKISPKFLITKTPFDGVEASQNKTRVFEYDFINEYDKVLFLDCDIICARDINNIFNKDIKADTLYTAYNSNLNYSYHKNKNYGFALLEDNFVTEMRTAKQMPFNAGQFLFKNSERMKKHFSNVCWFMKNWAGEYFFEQPFMCYYFCKSYITNHEFLQKNVSIVSTTSNNDYKINDDTTLVHFITPPSDAKKKLEFIKNFELEKKVNNSKIKNYLFQIKDSFEYIFKRKFLFLKRIFTKNKKSSIKFTGYARDLVKTNTRSSYPNTSYGKNKVIQNLNKKYEQTLKLSTQSTGNKNLIYYSVAGTKDWVDLLSISLQSVEKFKDIDLDVLLITTSTLKKEILKLNIDKLNIDFHIVPEPIDGVHASMNKLLIYKYKKIKNYDKVLFLDCDTKITKGLSNIFDRHLNPEKFYTAWKAYYINKVLFDAFKQPFHGIGLYTENDIENCKKNNQLPFNAGQFLFSVNRRMLKHIENIHWLSKEWPGEYFFEQAFLVHYMCLNNLTESTTLDKMVNLYSIDAVDPSRVTIKDLNDENIVIYHFIGKSANIDHKLNFIKNFSHANI